MHSGLGEAELNGNDVHAVALQFAPNSHGLMKRQIQTSAVAVICGAVRKPDTSAANAQAPLRRSSENSGGNTNVTPRFRYSRLRIHALAICTSRFACASIECFLAVSAIRFS